MATLVNNLYITEPPTTSKLESYRFDKKLPFEIESYEPRVHLFVNCADSKQIFPTVLISDIEILKDAVIGYNDFLVEDTNMTKWKLDNKTTGSFVFGSTSDITSNTFANEYLYTYNDGKDILINYMTFAKDFDIPQMQELQKRMFESIKFYP